VPLAAQGWDSPDAYASGAVTANGLVRSVGAVSVQSTTSSVTLANGAHLRSVATSGTGVTLTASHGLTLAAGSTVSGEGPSTELRAGGAIHVQGNVTSTGDINITSTSGSVTVDTAIAGAKLNGSDVWPSNVTLTADAAGQNVRLAGVASQALTVRASGNVDSTGTLRVAVLPNSNPRSLSLTSTNGQIGNNSGVTGLAVVGDGAVSLTAHNEITLRGVQSNGLVTLTSEAHRVTVAGAVTGVVTSADTNTPLPIGAADTPAASGLVISAPGAVSINGAQLGADGLKVGQSTPVGSLSLGSNSISSTGAVQISTVADLITSALISSGRSVQLTTAGSLTVGNGVANATLLESTGTGGVQLQATGNLTLNGHLRSTSGTVGLTSLDGNITASEMPADAALPYASVDAGANAATSLIQIRAGRADAQGTIAALTDNLTSATASGFVSMGPMVAQRGIAIEARRDVILHSPLGGEGTGYNRSTMLTGYRDDTRPNVGTLRVTGRGIETNGLNLDGFSTPETTEPALSLSATLAIVINAQAATNKGGISLAVSGSGDADGIYIGNDVMVRGYDSISSGITNRRTYPIELTSRNIFLFDNTDSFSAIPDTVRYPEYGASGQFLYTSQEGLIIDPNLRTPIRFRYDFDSGRWISSQTTGQGYFQRAQFDGTSIKPAGTISDRSDIVRIDGGEQIIIPGYIVTSDSKIYAMSRASGLLLEDSGRLLRLSSETRILAASISYRIGSSSETIISDLASTNTSNAITVTGGSYSGTVYRFVNRESGQLISGTVNGVGADGFLYQRSNGVDYIYLYRSSDNRFFQEIAVGDYVDRSQHVRSIWTGGYTSSADVSDSALLGQPTRLTPNYSRPIARVVIGNNIDNYPASSPSTGQNAFPQSSPTSDTRIAFLRPDGDTLESTLLAATQTTGTGRLSVGDALSGSLGRRTLDAANTRNLVVSAGGTIGQEESRGIGLKILSVSDQSTAGDSSTVIWSSIRRPTTGLRNTVSNQDLLNGQAAASIGLPAGQFVTFVNFSQNVAPFFSMTTPNQGLTQLGWYGELVNTNSEGAARTLSIVSGQSRTISTNVLSDPTGADARVLYQYYRMPDGQVRVLEVPRELLQNFVNARGRNMSEPYISVSATLSTETGGAFARVTGTSITADLQTLLSDYVMSRNFNLPPGATWLTPTPRREDNTQMTGAWELAPVGSVIPLQTNYTTDPNTQRDIGGSRQIEQGRVRALTGSLTFYTASLTGGNSDNPIARGNTNAVLSTRSSSDGTQCRDSVVCFANESLLNVIVQSSRDNILTPRGATQTLIFPGILLSSYYSASIASHSGSTFNPIYTTQFGNNSASNGFELFSINPGAGVGSGVPLPPVSSASSGSGPSGSASPSGSLSGATLDTRPLGASGGAVSQGGNSAASLATIGDGNTSGSSGPPSTNDTPGRQEEAAQVPANAGQFGTSADSSFAVGQRAVSVADMGRGGPLGGAAASVFRKRFPLASTSSASSCVPGVVSVPGNTPAPVKAQPSTSGTPRNDRSACN
jgi:hypothetical protein